MEMNLEEKGKPCRTCRRAVCPQEDCGAWQVWFLGRWEEYNRYLWLQMDALGRREPRGFCYELPHMVKSPCDTCPCRDWCDTPCAARIKWWDARIGRLRKRLR